MLQFLHRKNTYLTPNLRRLFCNALIQPHFSYACSEWYPNLPKKLKNRIKLDKTNAFVSVYSYIKCHVYIKKDLKQLIGCPLKKDAISG